jgi:hypothetical protein
MSGRCFRLSLPLVLMAAAMIGAAPAMAMPASCVADYQKHAKAREDAVARINGFNKRRPTAQQACSAFNTLNGAENRFHKWLSDNKDWCQVPDGVIEQLDGARAQSRKIAGQACTAAKRQAAGAPPPGAARGPQPGAGIRLPQGAL